MLNNKGTPVTCLNWLRHGNIQREGTFFFFDSNILKDWVSLEFSKYSRLSEKRLVDHVCIRIKAYRGVIIEHTYRKILSENLKLMWHIPLEIFWLSVGFQIINALFSKFFPKQLDRSSWNFRTTSSYIKGVFL